MKTNTFIAIASLFLLLFTASCSEEKTKEEAKEYNLFLVQSIDPVITRMIDFEEAVYSQDKHRLKEIREELIVYIQKTRNSISSKKAFDGNENFKQAALKMVEFYNNISEHHYKQIIDLIEKDVEIKEETINRVEDIIDEIYHKENAIYFTFENEAGSFARKYGFVKEHGI